MQQCHTHTRTNGTLSAKTMPNLTNHNENSLLKKKISIGYSRNSPKFLGNESAVPGSVYSDHTLRAYVIQFHFNIIQPPLPRFFRFSAHDVFPIMHGHPTCTDHLILNALLTPITPRDEHKEWRQTSRHCHQFPFTSSFLDRYIPQFRRLFSVTCFHLSRYIT